MVKIYLYFLILSTILIILSGCGGKMILYEEQLLSEADSLFRAGNYEYAKVKFAKIRDAHPETEAAKTSQFYLGYINVFYDNPFANWEAALREFKMFTTLYPQDNRIGEVNSWIRILIVMQSFKKEYQGTANKLELANRKEIKVNESKALLEKKTSDSYTEQLKICSDGRDSLVRKTKDLENVILDLERKCQDAGK
jgi:outer membrane protein assembly factor BamD (BamD/ComL family)